MRPAILGAGALGLTAALRLAQRGHRPMVFERESLPGGLAAGFELEAGMWLEKFYHHLFRSDREAIALIRELDLEHRLVWRAPVTASLHRGTVHQLDSAGSLLRYPPLPVLDRLRMGAVLAAFRAMPSARLFEGRTAEETLRRLMGRRGYEVVWEPLLRGKFGAAAPQVAMPWFWARVHDRTRELGYLRGGFQQLYDRLADRVIAAGGEVRLGTEVRSVHGAGNRWEVETAGGTERVDAVVSTLAPRLTARLVADLPDSWRHRHEWGAALGAHCLVLALDRPLTRAYWLNVSDPGYPFMAVVEHTNYLPPAEYGGRHLVYLGNYRPMDDPLMTSAKEDVLAAFLPHLARINPSFEPGWLRESWMFVAPYAQPVVTVDYVDHIPRTRSPIPGLWIASMFQVYPHDRGQNYSIALANRVARVIDGEGVGRS